jgi:alanyl-tRNA synthetase
MTGKGNVVENVVENAKGNIKEKAKAHTGEHILFRALSHVLQGMTVKKVELGKRNYFLVEYAQEITWDTILTAEIMANQIIQEGRPVKKIVGTRKDMKNRFPELRVRWDRIIDDTVTVVEVKDYDWAACVGDHVTNTRDIEYILVTRVNSIGRNQYEIEFEVGYTAKKEALKRSALAEKVSDTLKTSLDAVIPTIENLKKDNNILTESVRTLTSSYITLVAPEIIHGISVYVKDVSGADHKVLQKEAGNVTKNNALVVFVEQLESPFVVIACSASLGINCNELLSHIFPESKGGGRPEYVIARAFEKIDVNTIKDKITTFLEAY